MNILLTYFGEKVRLPFVILLMALASMMLAPASTLVQAQGPQLPARPPVQPDSRFGIVEAYLHPDYANATGAGWTRVHFGWRGLQKAGPGPLDRFYFGSTVTVDQVLNRELNANRQPVGLLIETPAWASGGSMHDVPRGLNLPYDHPNNLWGQFVIKTVQAYGDKVNHWIVWNEPDICDDRQNTLQWNGSPTQYAQLLRVASQAAKSVDPNAKILIAATTFWWDSNNCGRADLDYISQILAAIKAQPGNQNIFDALALNLYLDPDQIYKIIRDYRQLLQQEGFYNKEVWLTETNVQYLNDRVPYGQPPYEITPEEQTYFLVQAWSMAMAAGANRIEYFKMKDDPAENIAGQPYGMINSDGSLTPAFWTYRTIVTYLSGFKNARLQEDLREVVRYRETGTRVVAIEREQGWTTVVWNQEKTAQTVEVEAHASSALLVDPFGPVGRVDAVNGRYTLRLPAPEDAHEIDDRIGSRPYLLVEGAGANVLLERPSLAQCNICGVRNDNIATITPLSGGGSGATPPTLTPTATPTRTRTPAPSSGAGPTRTPTATPTRIVTPGPSTPPSGEDDWDIPNGHFYTQTGNGEGGFSVVDNAEAQFWSEFQRLGGLQTVGYPISRRYEKDGFVTQAFQKLVLQWRPDVRQAWPVNVFDELSKSGFDQRLLLTRQTPRPLNSSTFDRPGAPWPEIVAKRQALLNENPAIRAAYFAASDPLNVFGLPTSEVTDMDNHYSLRTQRAVFQQWKEDVPWASRGQVTIANGGDIAKELGWLPLTSLQPE